MKGVARYFCPVKEEKECGNCFVIKPLKEFHKTSYIKYKGQASQYRSACRPCRSEQAMSTFMQKRLESFPTLYWECDECDKMSHRRLDKCFHCGETKPKELK
jgi:hypothetical protein